MKKYILISLLIFLGDTVFSQSLKGVILDKSKTPIESAFVYINTSNDYTLSNLIGKFELGNVKVGDVLNVSFLGFKTIHYVIKEKDLLKELILILEDEPIDLEQVSVTNSVRAVSTILALDLKTNPVNSSQEVLRKVPGLFIAQHAGGGKAEQIFLRGFDIDHGTDIAITVDGMPVNMVSHAHGQGYADLHFLIPETIHNIDFAKGPYDASHGNFTTAGYVDFKTKDRLDNNTFGLEFGRFNTYRGFGAINLLEKVENQDAYLAAEFLQSDGPVESPQNFQRINVMGKYTINLKNKDRLSILFSHFQSNWRASGQIPQRLVDNGTITRWGSVDDTEGGNTSRNNFSIAHTKSLNEKLFVKSNAFYSYYDFELFSNFTFFLEDPINGDQIRQKEERNIVGFNTTLFQNTDWKNTDLEMNYGVGLRHDVIQDVGLSRTLNRENVLSQIALGNVNESNIYSFVNANWSIGKWTFNPSIRLDAFNFIYEDQLSVENRKHTVSKFFLAPKFNLIYNPNNRWQFFLKSGRGFHSNDSRVVVAQNGEEILPGALGADLGLVWKPFSRLWLNVALWNLYLKQEFIYVGDAGIVEPSGSTHRRGIDIGLRYQLNQYLFTDIDFNYTYARFINVDPTSNRIPLAPELTTVGRLSFQHPKGFSANLSYRYLNDRPANENNTIIADGYFVVDTNASYSFKKFTFGINIENIFNQEWNEAQFATESRLRNESIPVEEIHFTPGVPFFLKGNIKYQF